MALWDVALQKLLKHGTSRFALDVRFATDSRRLALVGPSGAGKTQTLRMIAGIVHPDRGRVAIGGRVLHDAAAGVRLPPQQRRLAVVFQDYALFPHLTVRQNIAFAGRQGWLNPARRGADPVAERWIERLHLQPVAELFPHQISGGQRQRTALARALRAEPAALLLDEPFAALDRRLRSRLREELAELVATLRLPLLLITHDDDDVRALADEVLQIDGGRIVDALPPQEDAERPGA